MPEDHSGFVDVRDVAELHLHAMTNPAPNGERFITISGSSMWLLDVARVLKRRMGSAAAKVRIPPSQTSVRYYAVASPSSLSFRTSIGIE
jgi:dihydroflavonol-4-reductase